MATDFVRPSDNDAQRLRRIVLFGRNVASYKFALSKSLLELASGGQEGVPLADLAVPFSRQICEHLKSCDRQGTFQSSRFLDACRYFNAGQISHDELITATVLLGFQNVIDAFHVVGQGEVDNRFFIDERRGTLRGIRLTESLLELCEKAEVVADLREESETRWRLVETAWEASAEGQMVRVLYDSPRELLLPALLGERRPVVEVRPALNGYQKGYCFYCFRPLIICGEAGSASAEVDHLFPFVWMARGLPVNLDQVWNLVLACRECNRGAQGKFAAMPDHRYVLRLWHRNEWLISSHHPLRETIIAQTGSSSVARQHFLRQVAEIGRTVGGKRAGWRAPSEEEARF